MPQSFVDELNSLAAAEDAAAAQQEAILGDGNGDGQNIDIDFFAAPNGKILSSEYKDWLGENIRESLLESATDSQLANAITQMYRPGSIIGDGGTADIIRFESETGILLSRSGHRQKGVEMLTYLSRLLDSGKLSVNDKSIIEKLIENLKSVLGGLT